MVLRHFCSQKISVHLRLVIQEKLNNEVFLRPRFTIDLDENFEKVIDAFKSELSKSDYLTRFSDGHIIIDIPKNEAHFWSPQLHLEVVWVTSDKSILKGLFGPKPQVWTLFMFIHFVVGVSFLIFSAVLYVNWNLNEGYLLPLVMVIFLPLFWVLLYFLGRIGKSTGKAQMKNLHALMRAVINQ